MRKMTNGPDTLTVVEFIMTINMWEYYVTDQQQDGIALCLVHGFCTEIGDVDLEEIEPYITVRTKDLTMQPAIGWKWEGEND